METLKQFKKLGIFLGLILCLFGLILLIFPTQIINILATIIGALVAITGIFRIFTISRRWRDLRGRVFQLVVAIILFVLGIYILINTNVTITFIGFIIGIFAVISAIDRFSVAHSRKKSDLPITSTMTSGLVHLIFGFAMLIIPLYSSSLIVMIAGIYLILAGIMIGLSASYFLDL